VVKFEAKPFDRFALEGTGGNGGAGFGLATSLYDQKELGVDMTLGIDELFFAPQQELFGVVPENTPSRLWLGVAHTWKWARLRSSVAVEAEGDMVEFVPYGSAEVLLPLNSSVGWETSYSHDVWRHHAGVNMAWEPFSIGFGVTEIQSWMFRNGQFGMWNMARPGSSTGFDNPGWWFSVTFALPHIEKPVAVPAASTDHRGTVHLDSTDLAHLEVLFVERQVRADLAELALRMQSEGVDPIQTASLRRRILAGAVPAREALWKIAIDTSADPVERSQAVATAAPFAQESDLPALAILTETPSSNLRMETAMALRRLDSPMAKELLKRLLNDPDEDVRAAARGVSTAGAP